MDDEDRNTGPTVTGAGPDSKLMQRIVKMLRRAERPTGPDDHEAEHSHQMAIKLMVQHTIEEADVRAAMGEAQTPDDPIEAHEMVIKGPVSWPQSNYLGLIGEHLGCNVIRWRIYEMNDRGVRKATGDTRLAIVGRRSTVKNVIMLLRSLNTQCLFSLSRRQKEFGRDRSFTHSYGTAFAAKCFHRVQEAFRQEVTDGHSEGALVVQSDAEKAKVAADELYPGTRKAKAPRPSDRAGFRAGAIDGEQADLSQTRLGGGRAEIEGSRR